MTAQEFKAARFRARLPQWQLAMKLGVCYWTVEQYEQGHLRIPGDIEQTLTRLASTQRGQAKPRFLDQNVILSTVIGEGWNVTRSARKLGLSYASLHYFLRRKHSTLFAAARSNYVNPQNQPRFPVLRSKRSLSELIQRHDWNLTRAAREVGTTHKTVLSALKCLMPQEYVSAKRSGLIRCRWTRTWGRSLAKRIAA